MILRDVGGDLWRHTDLRPADVDVAQIYDGFSFITMAWLEALGFCGAGESGPFIEGGRRITLEGEIPINTARALRDRHRRTARASQPAPDHQHRQL